ncbi:MAG TPA: SAM-dependent methyltransferase [Alphaproteobacteria bacterium]|nr:SAM-dependent methyltransferase [Alphaproteobacteria bacterium]
MPTHPPASNVPHWLAVLIAGRDGFISVHDYMAACLYHPQHGYYSRGDNFTEAQGKDFTTAPLLSPLFGATIANWITGEWQHLGKPTRFTLAEAGPGDGTLMFHLLNHLPHHLASTCEVLMVETSPALTALQQQKLGAFQNITWATSLTAQPHPVILVANELLDAFPVQVFEFKNGAWLEHGFDEHLNPATRPATPPPPPLTSDTVEGDFLEVSHGASSWLKNAAKACSSALFIDYGASLTHHQRITSAQAMHRHQPVPFTHLPGQTDLTAHVNFAQVAGTLGGHTTTTDLAKFLLKFKILNAAEATINSPETAAALHRLLHPTRMGALFKALEYRQN